VVHVGPLHHSRHGGVDIARLELMTAMGFPKGDEIGWHARLLAKAMEAPSLAV